jgi:hypothetical protein
LPLEGILAWFSSDIVSSECFTGMSAMRAISGRNVRFVDQQSGSGL